MVLQCRQLVSIQFRLVLPAPNWKSLVHYRWDFCTDGCTLSTTNTTVLLAGSLNTCTRGSYWLLDLVPRSFLGCSTATSSLSGVSCYWTLSSQSSRISVRQESCNRGCWSTGWSTWCSIIFMGPLTDMKLLLSFWIAWTLGTKLQLNIEKQPNSVCDSFGWTNVVCWVGYLFGDSITSGILSTVVVGFYTVPLGWYWCSGLQSSYFYFGASVLSIDNDSLGCVCMC